jgi:hypothetical protein
VPFLKPDKILSQTIEQPPIRMRMCQSLRPKSRFTSLESPRSRDCLYPIQTMAMNDIRLAAPIDISLEASMPVTLSQTALAVEAFLEGAELDGNARAGLVRLHAGLTKEIENGWDGGAEEPEVEGAKGKEGKEKKKKSKKRKGREAE